MSVIPFYVFVGMFGSARERQTMFSAPCLIVAPNVLSFSCKIDQHLSFSLSLVSEF